MGANGYICVANVEVSLCSEPIDSLLIMIHSPTDVLELTRSLSVKKYQTPLGRLFVLGVLAGAYISIGGLLSTMAAAGLAEIGASNPIIPKLIAGMTFPVGLMLVVLVGAELFTGNTAYLIPATLRGDIPKTYFLRNWAIVYLANLVGALLFDYLLVYRAGILDSPIYASYIVQVAEAKVGLSYEQAFLRGIGANWLVCLAVWLGFSSRDMLGRLVGLWWPVMAFVTIGLEHSIANMFYLPTGMLYGANVSIGEAIWHNLLPSTLGNIVGGAGLVGGLYAWLYSREA